MKRFASTKSRKGRTVEVYPKAKGPRWLGVVLEEHANGILVRLKEVPDGPATLVGQTRFLSSEQWKTCAELPEENC